MIQGAMHLPGYQIFVDESGDHGLATIDPQYPVFVLAFCVIAHDDYMGSVLPQVTALKLRHFGHDQVILHERDIRKDHGDFIILREPTRKAAFLEEMNSLIHGLPITLFASVIRKDHLVGKYSSPGNPYELALEYGLERVDHYLSRQARGPGRLPVIIEKRGRREDGELELEFRRICGGGNYKTKDLKFFPRFVPKSANVIGLQIADLVARPIGLSVQRPEQHNRAFELLEKKLYRGPGGKIDGWGLKIFP